MTELGTPLGTIVPKGPRFHKEKIAPSYGGLPNLRIAWNFPVFVASEPLLLHEGAPRFGPRRPPLPHPPAGLFGVFLLNVLFKTGIHRLPEMGRPTGKEVSRGAKVDGMRKETRARRGTESGTDDSEETSRSPDYGVVARRRVRITDRTAMSAGVTPGMREAWPRFSGRIRESFSLDSKRSAGMEA